MSYFTFENKKIYYTELGEGTPLLLLHGNTASSNMYAEISEEYAKSFKVILIDFLGHGKSDRLNEFPADLWFYEAEQVIALLKEKQYGKADLIGSSGGALVAINAALEAPGLVNKVIADSFEGEKPLKAFTEIASEDRERSKQEEGARMFYYSMHGADWEGVVDNDTSAILRHDREIGCFFHKELRTLQPEILLTGSKGDEFVCALDPEYFQKLYGDMIHRIGHGSFHLFEEGGHPAMLSNREAFLKVSLEYLEDKSGT